jgi:hypothetical protein
MSEESTESGYTYDITLEHGRKSEGKIVTAS